MAILEKKTVLATEPRYPELRGQVAVITGAGRGIGKSIALRLGKEGVKLVINDRVAHAARDTVQELRKAGAHALAVTADVGKTDEAARLLSHAVDAFGGVHVLINNAAHLDR